MKIAIFEIEPWERQVFEGLEGEPKLVHEGGHMNAVMAERYADADIISTFIHSKLDGDRRRAVQVRRRRPSGPADGRAGQDSKARSAYSICAWIKEDG